MTIKLIGWQRTREHIRQPPRFAILYWRCRQKVGKQHGKWQRALELNAGGGWTPFFSRFQALSTLEIVRCREIIRVS